MKYYQISVDGVSQQGPLDEETLRDRYSQGEYLPATLVWTEGMSDWKPISEVFPDVYAASPKPKARCPYGNPFSALWHMFKHYADFKGRATRKEFWMAWLGCWIVAFVILFIGIIIDAVCFERSDDFVVCLTLRRLWGMATLVPSIAISVRRLHDVGRSAWLVVIFYLCLPVVIVSSLVVAMMGIVGICSLITLVIGFILLILFCRDSQRGTNKYGPSEKYPD